MDARRTLENMKELLEKHGQGHLLAKAKLDKQQEWYVEIKLNEIPEGTIGKEWRNPDEGLLWAARKNNLFLF